MKNVQILRKSTAWK